MLFSRDYLKHGNDRQRRIYATYEIIYTLVDFIAAILFVIGSIMFFSAAWETFGTWLFLLGSLCFAAKPSLRLMREIKLASIGDVEDLASRFES